MEKKITYNRCKLWQLGTFAMSDASTNCWLFFMGFVSYYATGFAGLAVMVFSTLATSMRIFDAVTDPIIGWVMDRTNGKFGKFRPFMVLGNLIIITATFLMISTTHLLPDAARFPYFVLTYAVYIIGYTLHNTATKAAQSCMTNDPSQRPVFAMFNGVYVTLIFSVLPLLVTNYLIPRNQGFTLGFFRDFWMFTSLISFSLMVLAVIGVWAKDKPEFYGLGGNQPKVKFREYWDVIKNNRGIQMLTLAASSDKLATNISGNSTVLVMLFAIIMGNYSTYGELSAFTAIPQFIVLFVGIQVARKLGQKTALVGSTWLAIIFHVALMLIIVLGDPTQISLQNWGFMTVLFLIFYVLMGASKNVATNMVMPMIPDVADYETYRTGRYVPGMMSTLFSFVDKLISSLSTTIVGAFMAVIGFTTALPTEETPFSSGIFTTTLILYFGFPILGWICTLVAMKFYPLTESKMREIQSKIADMKKQVATEGSEPVNTEDEVTV